MTNDHARPAQTPDAHAAGDPLAEALAGLEAPPLDPGFAARVLSLARGELVAMERAAPAGVPFSFRLALSGALVPSLLISAAAVRTAETVQAVEKIYAHPHEGGHGTRATEEDPGRVG